MGTQTLLHVIAELVAEAQKLHKELEAKTDEANAFWEMYREAVKDKEEQQ